MLGIISSQMPDPDLVMSLGSLGLFDLSALADQAGIWSSIPTSMVRDFIDASFEGMIHRLALGQVALQQIVSPLRVPLNDRMRVLGAVRNILEGREGEQVTLFVLLDVLNEEDFLDWYSSLISSGRFLSSVVALQIGDLISERGWKRAAERVVDVVLDHKRYDLNRAVSPLQRLLRLRQPFALMFAGISVNTQEFAPNDLYDYLELVLVERFPGGPREHALWSRAKGSDADLRTSGSGREQWRYALELIRNEARGAPALEALLSEAINVYRQDKLLNWLHNNRNLLASKTKGR